jgi:hypothetical protein
MSVEVNSIEELPVSSSLVDPSTGIINEEGNVAMALKSALKKKADRIKSYLVNKFKIKADRIIADVKLKAATTGETSKGTGKMKKLFTEFVKL